MINALLDPNPIRTWFLGRQDHFVAFAQADARLEGWLKGELIVLLRRRSDLIDQFESEAKTQTRSGRRQVGFRVWLRGAVHSYELKALCISQASGTLRKLRFHFREDHVGLIKDSRELDSIPDIPARRRWAMGLAYPAPGAGEWAEAAASLPRRLGHWCRVTRTGATYREMPAE